MKKIFFALLTAGLAFAGMRLASTTKAATISLFPLTANVQEGKSLNLEINAIPTGGRITTIKIGLEYPAEYLQLSSFVFANSWMPLSQSGYDVVDNIGGRAIKTAGYPGGFTNPTKFGTAIFAVKKSGNATVALSSDSLMLDINNANIYDKNGSKANFVLTPLTKVVSEVPKGIFSQKTPEPIKKSVKPEAMPIKIPEGPSTLLLAMASVLTLFDNQLINLSIAAAALICALLISGRRYSKKR